MCWGLPDGSLAPRGALNRSRTVAPPGWSRRLARLRVGVPFAYGLQELVLKLKQLFTG
ncbi:MFS transporter small subunit [Streptomyces pathocidini]|uniref:MFS transporter small subunit n=1 Tax=Streptomyces pathocidini TaxID=1650571 RepID=UPI003B8A9272